MILFIPFSRKYKRIEERKWYIERSRWCINQKNKYL